MSKPIGYISLIFLALMFATVPAALAQSDKSNPSNDTPQAVSPERSGADDQVTPSSAPEDAGTNGSSDESGLDPNGQPEADSAGNQPNPH